MYETRLDKGEQAQEEGEYEEIDVMMPQGFETAFVLPDEFLDNYASIRVAALDKEGELLEFSQNATILEESRFWESVFVVVLCVGIVIGSGIFFLVVVRKQTLTMPTMPTMPPAWQQWSSDQLSGMEKWNPWSIYRGYRKLG
jgi:hypothetical protein